MDASDGIDDGRSNVNGYGLSHGPLHGITNGIGDRFSRGDASGAGHGTAIEQALGVKLHVIDGVVTPLVPGEEPPPDQSEHAQALLRWLQADEIFAGNEVPSPLLAQLYVMFCEPLGWEPYAWPQIAREFKRHSGVKSRQLDRRNKGQPSCIVYRIPRRKNVSNIR